MRSRCVRCRHCCHQPCVHQGPRDELVAKTNVVLRDVRLRDHRAEDNWRGDEGGGGGKVEGGRQLGGGDVAGVRDRGHAHRVDHRCERLSALLHHGEGPCLVLRLGP